MIELKRNEKIKRLNLYKDTKLYTYLKDNTGYFYNGFILEVSHLKTKIKDDVLGEIPILIDDLKIIVPSKKKNKSFLQGVNE